MKAKLLDDGDYRVTVKHANCSMHVGAIDAIYADGVRIFTTAPLSSMSVYLALDEAEALRDALSIVIEQVRAKGDE